MTHMLRALELARQALGTTSPKPAVGAVVVKGRRVVGEGASRPAGGGHAPVVALQNAGEQAKGATLYVTLEPCNHEGLTPMTSVPCTDVILAAGVSQVRYAVIDPNPKVNGRGIARLKEGGVKVSGGEEADKVTQLVEGYAKHVTTGMPFLTAKYAMSLDGKIATRSGQSRWITGPESRRFTHRLREGSDVVMVGAGTVKKDNPQLTARGDEDNLLSKQPLRVIVDSHGGIPEDSKVLTDSGKTMVALGDATASTMVLFEEMDVDAKRFLGPRGLVDLRELMTYLGQIGLTTVLVEGGGILLGALFDEGLVDKVVAQVAPIIVGGRLAVSPVQGEGILDLADAVRLKQLELLQFGADITLVGYCR